MSKIYYSASTKGFYDTALKGYTLPDDAKEVSEEWRAECLLREREGKVIVADDNGLPIAKTHVNTPEEAKLEAIIKIEDKFRTALLGTVKSNALQQPHDYYCDNDSRNWLSFCIATGGDAQLDCMNNGGVKQRLLHTNAQLKQVAIDIMAKIEAEYVIMDDAKKGLDK